MTLVVGIKCTDGAVLAADSIATLGDANGPTVTIPGVSKLELIGSDLAFGFTGHIGLSQDYIDRLSKYMGNKGNCHYQSIDKAKASLEGMLRETFKPRLEFFRTLGDPEKMQGYLVSDIQHGTLIAFPNKTSGVEIVEFTAMCSGERITEEIPFASIGSGKSQADPFLSFFRRLLFKDGLPDVDLATMVAVWVLDITRKHHPGGVGDAIMAIILRNGQQGCEIHVLREMDLGETLTSIKEHEAALGAMLLKLPPSGDKELEAMPEALP